MNVVLINSDSSIEWEAKILELYENKSRRYEMGILGGQRVIKEFSNNSFDYLMNLINQNK